MSKVTGIIKKILPVQEVSEKFSKQEFVLEIPGEYPQSVIFQTVNGKMKELDSVAEGSEATVEYNLRGREWTNPQGEVKYFNTLEAWKITAAGSGKGDDNGDVPF